MITAEPIIRNYNTSDKEAVINLFRLNTPNYFSPEEEKDLIYYLENEIDEYFLIEVNNIIVGCGGINLSEDKTIGKISWDFLHPNFQGKALGSKLLKYRIEKLQQVKSITKITVRTSQLAYQFYGKQGFRLIAVVEDYWAKGFHLYEMEHVKSPLE